MNLVQIATWIQEGYKYYSDNYQSKAREGSLSECKKIVFMYVMRKCKGRENPQIITKLIDLENSIPNKYGLVEC